MSQDPNRYRLDRAVTKAVRAARGGIPPPQDQWEFQRTGWSIFAQTLANELGQGAEVSAVPAPIRDGALLVVIDGTRYCVSIMLGQRDGVEIYDVHNLWEVLN